MTSRRDPRGKLTIAAVTAYAAELRRRAEAARLRDPYASPYSPTDAAASKVFSDELAAIRRVDQQLLADGELEAIDDADQRHRAAVAARGVLARRVAAREHEQAKEDEQARRARARHQRRQRKAQAEREADRAGRTLGARLDDALRELQVASEVPASRLDPDRALSGKGSQESRAPVPIRDAHSQRLQDARHLVFSLEEEAARARRRLVEREAA
jgi:hypothetical protein